VQFVPGAQHATLYWAGQAKPVGQQARKGRRVGPQSTSRERRQVALRRIAKPSEVKDILSFSYGFSVRGEVSGVFFPVFLSFGFGVFASSIRG
jgi:hypothetical protein